MTSKAVIASLRSLGITALAFLPLTAHADPPANKGYRLVFDDEFTGNAVDTSLWTTNGYPWGSLSHQDQAVKVASQLSVANGVLTITSQPGTVPGQPAYIYNTPFGTLPLNYLSGCITSYQRWHKGYFEGRFKMPWQTSTWPAFWMLQDGWPPEMDIFEIHGNTSQEQYTYHYSTGNGGNTSWGGTYNGPNFSAGWHTFGMEWTDQHIDLYIDGNKINSYTDTNAIGQMNKMYLLIEDQIGGWAPAPIASQFPAQMQVDWVRVWQITGPPSGLYRLTPKNALNLALSGQNGATTNGTAAVIATATATAPQQWYLNAQSDGSYTLQNNANLGQNLDLAGGATASGSPVDLWQNNNLAPQRWNLVFNSDKTWSILPALSSTSALEVRNASTTTNSVIDIAPNANASNQEWLLQAPSGPLQITNLAISNITDTSATLTWTTNYPTDTSLLYGTASNFGSSAAGTPNTTAHSLVLTGLTPNTLYYFAPSATDIYGDTATGRTNTLRTVADNTDGLTISALSYTTDSTTGSVTATAIVTNNSSTTLSNVSISTAVLAGCYTTSAVPIAIGTMAAHGNATVKVTFPQIFATSPVGFNLYGMATGTTGTTTFTLSKTQTIH